MSGRVCNPSNVQGFLNYNELHTPLSFKVNAAAFTAAVSDQAHCKITVLHNLTLCLLKTLIQPELCLEIILMILKATQ